MEAIVGPFNQEKALQLFKTDGSFAALVIILLTHRPYSDVGWGWMLRAGAVHDWLAATGADHPRGHLHHGHMGRTLPTVCCPGPHLEHTPVTVSRPGPVRPSSRQQPRRLSSDQAGRQLLAVLAARPDNAHNSFTTSLLQFSHQYSHCSDKAPITNL